MKRKEGKRGTRMQDILIDLMWKLRSKGFGDQGSHTKKGELTAIRNNKLHLRALIPNDPTAIRKFVSKYIGVQRFPRQALVFLFPSRSELKDDL